MIATSTVVPTVTCDGNKIGALAFNTVPDAAASVTAFSLYAQMIQINFQSSDLPSPSGPQSGNSAGVVPVPVPTPTGAVTAGTSQTAPSSSDSASSSQESAQGTTSTDNAEQQTTNTSGQLDTAPATNTAAHSSSSSASSAADLQTSGTGNSGGASSGFPRMAAIGIGVGGGLAALLIGGSAVMVCLRRRRKAREDEELDRLYGLGKLDSNTGLSRADEFPGFYRGQRPTGLGVRRPMDF